MEFRNFFSMMKNRLSDGSDAPSFFRELIAMITDVSDEDWDTPKDPATKLTPDTTIRSYIKRGLSQKFARKIVYRLSPDMFIDSLDERTDTILSLLADDYSAYDPKTTIYNVAEKLCDCFVDIIRRAAGLVSRTEAEYQLLEEQAYELKRKYGEYLRDETSNTCAFPGCGKSLSVTKDGKIAYVYEVALIDYTKKPSWNNLLAMCPMCRATYAMDNNKKLCEKLQGVKKILVAHKQSMKLLDDMPLEKGIVGVISKIKELKETDLITLSLEPKDIRTKINPNENLILYRTVKSYVDTYYGSIKEIIINANKSGEINYDEVQNQMRALYEELKKANKTQIEIFNELSRKIQRVSLQEDIFCQIVVAYFIAKCEVFDAITE